MQVYPILENLPFTHLTQSDVDELIKIARHLPQGALCVELGSYLGASSIVISSQMPANAHLVCVDTWQNDAMTEGPRDTFSEFTANTAKFADRIEAIRGRSRDAAQHFGRGIDFLFVDADHTYEGCYVDLISWLPNLNDNAYIAFHDVGWAEGVQRVVRDVFIPVQKGPGRLVGNIYWAQYDKAKLPEIEAACCVISSRREPGNSYTAQYQKGLNGRPLNWISSGTERSAGTSSDQRIRVIDAGGVGLVTGRNRALLTMDEEIVIYLDDDVTLATNWYEKIVEPFQDSSIHFVGCRYLPEYAHEPPAWIADLWQEDQGFRYLWQLSLLDGGNQSRFCKQNYIFGLCFAARRETLLKLGGFHPDAYPWPLIRYRGDGETGISMRAEKLGYKAYYQAETSVAHKVPAERMTVEYFEKRAFIQGISNSYSELRMKAEAIGVPHDERRPERRKSLLGWFSRQKENFQASPPNFFPKRDVPAEVTAQEVQMIMNQAAAAGYDYHQKEFASDPILRDWVLRENYLHNFAPSGR